ncbi:MAG: small subunit ribosomal protein [Solirubrobacterales bacterium]|nr:small subunit ribosomal protein [Solirubrobacterales bacterium]
MADEENKNEETTEETPGETPVEEPKADETPPEEPKAEETPAEEAPAEEAPVEEAPAEEAPAEEAPAEDAPADAPAPAAAGSSDDDELSWKARQRLERSRQPSEAKPPQTPEERTAERATRRAAAKAERSRYRKKARTKRQKGTPTSPAEHTPIARKVREGTVVSNKADKTITVRVDVVRRHPTYEKVVRHSGTLHAHDERNEAAEGDLVKIVETRPMSRLKRWRLTEIVEKAK